MESKKLETLKRELEEKEAPEFRLKISVDNIVQYKEFTSMERVIDYIREISPNRIIFAVVETPSGQLTTLDPYEVQAQLQGFEKYKVEIIDCSSNDWRIIRIVSGMGNALDFQVPEYFKKVQITRLMDEKVILEKPSSTFRIDWTIKGEAKHTFETNSSLWLAERKVRKLSKQLSISEDEFSIREVPVLRKKPCLTKTEE